MQRETELVVTMQKMQKNCPLSRRKERMEVSKIGFLLKIG